MAASAADRPARRRSLDGATCVVTGASRGIGSEIATELAREGATVVINFRSSEAAARETVGTIEALDGTAVSVRADVSAAEDVRRMAAEVRDEVGRIDVLVNNAGITADRTVEAMSRDDWERVIGTNLGGVFNCTKAFFEDVKGADEGRIINVASVVGQRGNYGQANYAAAKSGLFGFTRTVALELAPHGSTANCVAPGFTRTDMVAEVPEDIREDIREEVPLGRFASVEEVASVVRFLAGPDASYVTGEVVNVNGGLHR